LYSNIYTASASHEFVLKYNLAIDKIRRMGVGVLIVSDHEGQVLATMCSSKTYTTDPIVWRLLEDRWKAMNFSRDMGIHNNIILEGDGLKIMHALPKEGQSWSWYSNLIDHSKTLLNNFQSWYVKYFKRKANREMIGSHPYIPLLTTSLKDDFSKKKKKKKHMPLKGGGEEWYVGVAANHFSSKYDSPTILIWSKSGWKNILVLFLISYLHRVFWFHTFNESMKFSLKKNEEEEEAERSNYWGSSEIIIHSYAWPKLV
jgi:hypothetical protein